MAGSGHAERDFDRHWGRHDVTPVPEQKKKVARDFLEPVFRSLAARRDEDPARLLDVGCGDGVHVEVLDSAVEPSPGSRFVGLDVSMDALRIAGGRGGDRWSFVHADAVRLPFADGSFDIAFSFGALAYTTDPAAAFAEMCRVTKPGGLVGLWVAPPHRGLAGMVMRVLRGACRAGGAPVARLIADAMVPLLRFLPTRSGLHLGNATWRQCREVVLVNLAPAVLAFPEPETVKAWFAAGGVAVLEVDRDNPVTVWGRRNATR